MSARVRPATLDDIEGIARVHVQAWRETYSGLMPDDVLAGHDETRSAALWRRVLQMPDRDRAAPRTLVVAELDGHVVGFANAGPPLDDEAPRPLQLPAIYLLAAHHGSGLGQRMLDAAIGDRPAYLWVVDANRRAQRFYSRNGFRPDGAVHDDEDLGVREIRMVR